MCLRGKKVAAISLLYFQLLTFYNDLIYDSVKSSWNYRKINGKTLGNVSRAIVL